MSSQIRFFLTYFNLKRLLKGVYKKQYFLPDMIIRVKSIEKALKTLIILMFLFYKFNKQMTKTQLIAQIAETLKVSKKLAAQLVDTFTETVKKGVKKDGEVRIQWFGTFKASKRAARTGVNPQNPTQKIKIPAMVLPTFKAGAEFKKAVR